MEVYVHLVSVLCYLIVSISFDCMLYLSFINHRINTATTMITITKITAKMITMITPADTPTVRIYIMIIFIPLNL